MPLCIIHRLQDDFDRVVHLDRRAADALYLPGAIADGGKPPIAVEGADVPAIPNVMTVSDTTTTRTFDIDLLSRLPSWVGCPQHGSCPAQVDATLSGGAYLLPHSIGATARGYSR
jgi:hypothetical protein